MAKQRYHKPVIEKKFRFPSITVSLTVIEWCENVKNTHNISISELTEKALTTHLTKNFVDLKTPK